MMESQSEENDMTTRKDRKIQMRNEHVEYMSDAAMEIEVNKDAHGMWQVRCYDARGYYIGGISSVSDFSVAQREAYRYAVAITQPIG